MPLCVVVRLPIRLSVYLPICPSMPLSVRPNDDQHSSELRP